MNNKKNHSLLIFGILIILGIFFYYLLFPADKMEGLVEKNRTFESRINGIVAWKVVNRGATTLKIENDTIYHFDQARNYKLKPYFIGDFIQMGDSIIKFDYSDTLYIIRNNTKQLFVIGKTLNKN